VSDLTSRPATLPMTLRPFRLAEDLDAVYRLQLDCDPTDALSRRQLARYAGGPRRLYLARYLGDGDTPGRPLAYVAFTPAEVTTVIEAVCVHPLARRRGVARTLIERLKASRNGRHARPVLGCKVREGDLAAQLLLAGKRGCGFRCFQTQPRSFRSPDEAAYLFAWCNPAFPEEYAAIAPQLMGVAEGAVPPAHG
jgi:GNAT superfamily N-acetyltransferase